MTNYQNHYDRLIDRAQIRKLTGYSEKHHILPRCLGGTDIANNIVRLTPEEHYVAHQLLVKIHPGNRLLIVAVVLMTRKRSVLKKYNNKLYGWVRRLLSERMSQINRERIYTPEIRANMSAGKRGKPKSPEHIAKVAAAHTGMKRSPETRAKMSASSSTRPRKPHTQETRTKMSISARERQANSKLPYPNFDLI